METGNRRVVARGWEEGGRGVVQWAERFRFAVQKRSRELLSHNVNLLNCTLKNGSGG